MIYDYEFSLIQLALVLPILGVIMDDLDWNRFLEASGSQWDQNLGSKPPANRFSVLSFFGYFFKFSMALSAQLFVLGH